MLFNKMRSAITPIDKIHTHPLNIGLCRGTLPIDTFRVFLEQDRLYLLDFSRALKRTAMRLPNERHRRLFYQLSSEAFRTQVNLHHKYLLKPQTQKIFQSAQLPRNKIPIIFNYTEYLLATANSSPVEVAVASLIPCFFIYSSLGLHMRSTVKENNPYRLWIKSYSNDRFLLSTQLIIQTAEELGDELGFTEKKNMIAAFVKSTEFEVSFWDHIYEASFEDRLKKKKHLTSFQERVEYPSRQKGEVIKKTRRQTVWAP